MQEQDLFPAWSDLEAHLLADAWREEVSRVWQRNRLQHRLGLNLGTMFTKAELEALLRVRRRAMGR